MGKWALVRPPTRGVVMRLLTLHTLDPVGKPLGACFTATYCRHCWVAAGASVACMLHVDQTVCYLGRSLDNEGPSQGPSLHVC